MAGLGMQAVSVDFSGGQLMQDAVDTQLVSVAALDGILDFLSDGPSPAELDLLTQECSQLIGGNDVIRIAAGNQQAVVCGIVADGENAVAAGELLRHPGQRLRIDNQLLQADALLPQAFCQHIAQVAGSDESQFHQHDIQCLSRVFLLVQGNA